MKIEVSYSENANLGNYQTGRFGLTIKDELEIKTLSELKKRKEGLFKLAKTMISEEVKKLKEERNG